MATLAIILAATVFISAIVYGAYSLTSDSKKFSGSKGVSP